MKISINQPAYIPWLGYFERIDFADKHIVLDHVDFEKNSFINRNKIVSNNGTQWLTIPLKKSINDKSIMTLKTENNIKWMANHLKSLKQNYSKTPFFKKYFSQINELFESNTQNSNFIEIIEKLNKLLLFNLGIDTEIIYSSELKINSRKSNLVLDICKSQNSKIYLSGINGKNYLDLNSFEKNEIKVLYQEYKCVPYHQQFDKKSDFISNLSVLDLLFNKGEDSINIIRKGRNYE